MQRGNVPQQFFVDNEFGYLVAEDGTEFFRSKRFHCEVATRFTIKQGC
jgi:hypothetical protein